jgi:DNA-binding IclR family transcriptional regulator
MSTAPWSASSNGRAPSPYTQRMVQSVAAMLRLLGSESEPLPLGQLASAVGLAKGTAHGLLKTLLNVGFVDQDPSGRYLLSADLLHLGSVTYDLNELRSLTLNWVDTLAARTGEAAGIAAYRDGRVVIAHHVHSSPPRSSLLRTGSHLHLHASAMGKVILAFDPGAARSVIGNELESLTFRTITQRPRLLTELADVRDRGAAISVEEVEPEIAEFAAPVRDRDGYVVAAVGIDGAVRHLCDERGRPRAEFVAEVVEVARRISRALGHGDPS